MLNVTSSCHYYCCLPFANVLLKSAQVFDILELHLFLSEGTPFQTVAFGTVDGLADFGANQPSTVDAGDQNQPKSTQINQNRSKFKQNHPKIDPRSTKIILKQPKSTKIDQNLLGGTILYTDDYYIFDG